MPEKYRHNSIIYSKQHHGLVPLELFNHDIGTGMIDAGKKGILNALFSLAGWKNVMTRRMRNASRELTDILLLEINE